MSAPVTPPKPYVIAERRSARARRVRLRLTPGGGVELVIPERAGAQARAQAWRFAEAQHGWILAALVRQAATHPARLPGGEGDGVVASAAGESVPDPGPDTLFFAGAPHRLAWGAPGAPSLSVAPADTDSALPPTLRLHGVARPPDPARRRALLRRLLRAHARAALGHLLAAEARRVGVAVTAFHLTDARTRWGTCRADGAVRLHWRLVLAPPEVARYVVVHELCHRFEMNHSPRFWAQVARHFPAWKPARAWLKAHGTALLGVLEAPATPTPAGGAAPDAD